MKTPGLVDVDVSPRLRHELAIEIDRDGMARAGVRPADLVKAMVPQERPIVGWTFPITLCVSNRISSNDFKKSADEMSLVAVRTEKGRPTVLLRDVAKIEAITVPSAVRHESGLRCVTVFGNVDGRTPQEELAHIQRIAKEFAEQGIGVTVD